MMEVKFEKSAASYDEFKKLPVSKRRKWLRHHWIHIDLTVSDKSTLGWKILKKLPSFVRRFHHFIYKIDFNKSCKNFKDACSGDPKAIFTTCFSSPQQAALKAHSIIKTCILVLSFNDYIADKNKSYNVNTYIGNFSVTALEKIDQTFDSLSEWKSPGKIFQNFVKIFNFTRSG